MDDGLWNGLGQREDAPVQQPRPQGRSNIRENLQRIAIHEANVIEEEIAAQFADLSTAGRMRLVLSVLGPRRLSSLAKLANVRPGMALKLLEPDLKSGRVYQCHGVYHIKEI